MPGDDHLVLADQDRVGETEFRDRGRDLGDLIGRMGPGIADVGHQPVGRHHLNLHGRRPPECGRPGRTPALVSFRVPASALATRKPKRGNPGRKPRKNVWHWRRVGPLPPAYDPARVEPGRGGAARGQASGAPPSEDRGALGLQEPCTSLRSWGNTGLKVLHLSRPKFDVFRRYNNVPGPPSSGFTTVFAAADFAATALRAGFSMAFRCLAMVRSDAAHLRHAVVRTTPAR